MFLVTVTFTFQVYEIKLSIFQSAKTVFLLLPFIFQQFFYRFIILVSLSIPLSYFIPPSLSLLLSLFALQVSSSSFPPSLPPPSSLSSPQLCLTWALNVGISCCWPLLAKSWYVKLGSSTYFKMPAFGDGCLEAAGTEIMETKPINSSLILGLCKQRNPHLIFQTV